MNENPSRTTPANQQPDAGTDARGTCSEAKGPHSPPRSASAAEPCSDGVSPKRWSGGTGAGGVARSYVAGFLFDETRKKVALIEKQKPDWQRGKLNGIGGKIEGDDESPLDAMVREFREETGATVTNWRWFCTLSFRGGFIYFFAAIGDVNALRTCEAEEVVVVHVCLLDELDTIPNLRWLIPLALDKDGVTAQVEDLS